MDSDIEAARPWVEAANPTYVTLIDQSHRLSSLYNMVNVPQAVWIDEQGRVVDTGKYVLLWERVNGHLELYRDILNRSPEEPS